MAAATAPTAQPPTHFVTVPDGAARHGVHPQTIRRWIAEGRLTAYRLGPRLIRLDVRELDSLLRPDAAA